MLDRCRDCDVCWVPSTLTDNDMRTVIPRSSLDGFDIEPVDFESGNTLNQVSALVSSAVEMPVLDEESMSDVKPKHRAQMTLPLLLLIFLISGVANRQPGMAERLAYDPTHPFRSYGTTLLTYSLVHANLWHLLGNLYFFYLFAGSVEETIGPSNFLVFAAVSTAISAFVHGLIDSRWLVGCSGMVAALMTYFVLTFPKALIKFSGASGMYGLRWIKLPAAVWATFWGIQQFVVLVSQAQGQTNISGAGHIGGIAAGFILYYFVFPPSAVKDER